MEDEGAEATTANDQEPRVCVPIQKEEEGVPAESGGAAEGGAAGERKTPQGEPGVEGETGWEGGERSI